MPSDPLQIAITCIGNADGTDTLLHLTHTCADALHYMHIDFNYLYIIQSIDYLKEFERHGA